MIVKGRPAAEVCGHMAYSKANFDRFEEAGATGLPQIVSSGALTHPFAEYGATGAVVFPGADARIGGFYQVHLDGGTQQIMTALASLAGFVRTANVRAADRDYGRFEASLSNIAGNVVLGARET